MRNFKISILFVCVGGALMSCSVRHSEPSSLTQQPLASPETITSRENLIEEALRPSLKLAFDYLVSVCDSQGKFRYQVFLDSQLQMTPKYNILRHSGTLYAMATYLKTYPDDSGQDTLFRATHYLKKHFIRPFPESSESSGVWSLPEVEGDDEPLQVKLGGTALGLLALLHVEAIAPGTTSIEELRALGKGLVWMQKEDGSFYSKYVPDEGGKRDLWVSLYYPGEAALALISLYEIDRNPLWLESSEKAIAFLAQLRVAQQRVEPDHWALLATKKILIHHSQLEKPRATRKEILFHAIQISQTLLPYTSEIQKKRVQQLGMMLDGRTCPTATRLEGLLAAVSFLPEEQKLLKKEILEVAHQGISFLLHSQVRAGPFRGGIPRYSPEMVKLRTSESSEKLAGEIRIDYVQHTLSALLQYQEMLQEKK